MLIYCWVERVWYFLDLEDAGDRRVIRTRGTETARQTVHSQYIRPQRQKKAG